MIATDAQVDRLEQWAVNFPFLQALTHHGPVGANSRVLDLGCGTGRLAWYLTLVTGCRIEGVERSEALSAVARRRIPCRHAAGESMPSELGLFDLVYCKDVLPSVSNKNAFFQSISKLLRPDGCFITCVAEATDFDEKPLYRAISGLRERALAAKESADDVRHYLGLAGFLNVTSLRLTLGRIAIDAEYLAKHADGSFANVNDGYMADSTWDRFSTGARRLHDDGFLLEYEWVRTLLVARRR